LLEGVDGELAEVENQNAIGGGGSSNDNDIFVPPSQGPDQLALSVKKHPLVPGLHVAVGDFNKAIDLLKKQLAIGNFEPLR